MQQPHISKLYDYAYFKEECGDYENAYLVLEYAEKGCLKEEI